MHADGSAFSGLPLLDGCQRRPEDVPEVFFRHAQSLADFPNAARRELLHDLHSVNAAPEGGQT